MIRQLVERKIHFHSSGPGRQRFRSLNEARKTMQDCGCWTKHQQMGRRWPVGCAALEITQRCNLDCTLCYLSEYSESVSDIPLDHIFLRIEEIYRYYGPDTDIQVTGGDPTLRKRDELIAIINSCKANNYIIQPICLMVVEMDRQWQA